MNATQPRIIGPRWLRWALVRDGRIVAEEVRSPDRPLTIGGNGDVAVPGRERELLVYRDGSWFLKVIEGLGGRTDDGAIRDLARGVEEIELSPNARGRIELGDLALLVQLVDRPAVKLKPQLPASLQGGLLKGADWWFTTFVAGSFLLHFAVVTFMMQADWPVETSLIPDRYITQIFIEPPPPEDVDVMEEDGGEQLADVGDEAEDPQEDEAQPPTEHADARPSRPSPRDPAPTMDADAVHEMIAHNLLIAGLSPDSRLSAFDALRDGAPTGNAAAVFDAVDGVGVATNSDIGRMPDERDGRAHSSGTSRDLGHLATRHGHGSRDVREGDDIVEVEVTVRPDGPIDYDPPSGGTPFDARQLVARLRPRMRAIQRCYENEINHGNPDAAGRLTLVMTVMPVGSLASVHIEDDTVGSERLAACAVHAISSVRVTPGPEEPVEARYPVVFSSPGSR